MRPHLAPRASPRRSAVSLQAMRPGLAPRRYRAAVPAGRPGRVRTYHASRNDCAVQKLPPSEDLRPAEHCDGQEISQVYGRQEGMEGLG
jgi:hypothetical protein